MLTTELFRILKVHSTEVLTSETGINFREQVGIHVFFRQVVRHTFLEKPVLTLQIKEQINFQAHRFMI